MKKVLFTLFVLVLTSAVCASTSMASIIGVYRGTFASTGGSDSLGLHDASFEFGVTFDCGARYIERFGFPVVDSVGHYLRISGSTGGADGFHFEADQIGFYPTFNGQYFAGGPLNGFAEFSIGGLDLQLIRLTDPNFSPFVGGLIDASHLGTTLHTSAGVNWTEGNTNYTIRDFSADIFDNCGVIPEPGTIAIWSVLGLAGVMVRRRKVA